MTQADSGATYTTHMWANGFGSRPFNGQVFTLYLLGVGVHSQTEVRHLAEREKWDNPLMTMTTTKKTNTVVALSLLTLSRNASGAVHLMGNLKLIPSLLELSSVVAKPKSETWLDSFQIIENELVFVICENQ